jgi:two-component system chemotaxis response regulator CheB
MIRVMIVEDSTTSRRLLCRWLDEDPTIQVVGQASDGRQAVEMAARLEPDLITMDVLMPDMDGLETTRRIMAHRPTPILILTAHADSLAMDIAFEAMKAGAVDLVPKPTGAPGSDEVWRRELLAKIKALAGVLPRPVASESRGEPAQTGTGAAGTPDERAPTDEP